MKMLRNIIFLFLISISWSCTSPNEQEVKSNVQEPPNILWLVAEDLGPYLPSFGDSTIATPNLSRLAAEGVRYTNVYSPSGVCAPSRAAIATGMYPSGIGANHMRTGSHSDETGLPAYQAVPPPEVKMFSELLRRGGYYCTNNPKTDYQFIHPVTAWDESSRQAHWRNRGNDQPFFSIFNFGVTHESGLFEPYERPEMVSKDFAYEVPPYLPDNEVTQRDLWKLYNNIAIMDEQIGKILDQLEGDGLLENTIIFFYGDHGGPLPRQKRLLYDAGLKVPMIVRYPDKLNAGSIDDQLINFIDFAPTILTMAGEPVPDYLDGQSFAGANQSERKYIHAAGDRFDAHTDVIRAVRDGRFKYIRNYRPDQGYYLPIAYRERIPTMQELLRMRDNGQLNEFQAQWFRAKKPREELFDCEKDPHELVNLAGQPEFAEKLSELSAEMDHWLKEIGDEPNLPERELIARLWQGADELPVTAEPIITVSNGMVNIRCETAGASIGYRLVNESDSDLGVWKVYTQAFDAEEGTELEVQAHRIGYKASKTISYQVAY